MKTLLPCFLIAAALPAQQQDAGRRAVVLDPILVKDAGQGKVNGATMAVTRLSGDQLAGVPHATVADLLRLAPGFTSVDGDGSGSDPRVMVRGFYGGGEAEYVVVLVDGRPVNRLNNGLVPWDALPSASQIASIEIIRGGASALYGDAALGGVINIITRSARRSVGALYELAGGNPGQVRANLALTGGHWGARALSGSFSRSDGDRLHSAKTTARGELRFITAQTPGGSPSGPEIRIGGSYRDYDEPGALLTSLRAQDVRGSDALFRFDHTTDQEYEGSVQHGWDIREGRLTASLDGGWRQSDATRTLALAPGYGDTQAREFTTTRGGALLQYSASYSGSSGLQAGAEANTSRWTSRYFGVFGGDREAYLTGTADRTPASEGNGTRTVAAVFAQYGLQPLPALTLSFGARYDHLHDVFTAESPTADHQQTSHSALSPKVGLNLGYDRSGPSRGNLYITAGRSFKAATPDQLYDQRRTPVPFPPYEITTSNGELRPQYGTSVEAGIYQDVSLRAPTLDPVSGSTADVGMTLAINVSAYTITMRDELDFDVEAFRYVNIGKSRHDGLEIGLRLAGAAPVALFANGTLQQVTARSGANEGNRLKAIPERMLDAGLTWFVSPRLRTDLVISAVGEAWLDDANTAVIPGHTTADVRASYEVRREGPIVSAGVRNLQGKRYASSGYLDPAGTGEAYWYPAAGRTVEIGVKTRW